MIENRMVDDYMPSFDYDAYEDYYDHLLEKDDEYYEDEIFERMERE